MITLEQARDLLSAAVRPLAPVECALVQALGMRLAESVRAVFDLPPDDVSEMDGYAGRSIDLGLRPLPISVGLCAGMAPVELLPETVSRIQTGAVIPKGADTVVAQEQVIRREGDRVSLPATRPGQAIRKAGEVCRVGQMLAEAGQVVSPQMAGLLGAAGPATVRVTPRPRLAIVTTGSELVGPDERPGSGRIRDSNAFMLQSLAASAHLPTKVYERIPDTSAELHCAVVAASADADLVVTSGGVSVGEYDLIRPVIEELGGEILFHRVAIRPGKPTLLAKLESSWVVGLPGNPMSALVAWHLFVQPVANRLAGDPSALSPEFEEARLLGLATNEGDRTTFAPAYLTGSAGDLAIQLVPWKGSHDLYAVSRANALAILVPGFKAGTSKRIPLLRL